MNAEVGKFKLGLCSFGSLILWISPWSPSDLLYRFNCHVDKQPIVGDLDSGLLATVAETIKPVIQDALLLFQDNIALSLHCTFQPLIFSDHGENANSYMYLTE